MDLDFNIDLSDITDINIDLDVMQDDLIALLKDLYQDTIQASKKILVFLIAMTYRAKSNTRGESKRGQTKT